MIKKHYFHQAGQGKGKINILHDDHNHFYRLFICLFICLFIYLEINLFHKENYYAGFNNHIK